MSRRSPSLLLTALEARAPFEAMGSLVVGGVLGMDNRGDGHTVMVIPGFGANDAFSIPMRAHLKARGFNAIGWGQGFNSGWNAELLERLAQRVTEARETSDAQVSLVGWSLGGLYARALAHSMPEDVRYLVTLGSPFAADPTATLMWPVYERINSESLGLLDDGLLEMLSRTPPVPTTAIMSRSDGVVDWQGSVEQACQQAETIEVVGSHVGLIANPAVLFAVAERLAQPLGQWRHFERSGVLRRLSYRRSSRRAFWHT